METSAISEATKFVTFKLDQEVFALEINRVREVLDVTAITRVPQTPRFMRGVINLRGNVVPVVDLRAKFGMTETQTTVDTRIIIVEIKVDGEEVVLGAMADSVREVIELEPDQIRPAPKIGTRLRTEFIRGMGRRGEEFIILLDIDQVFSIDELSLVQEADQATQAWTGQPGGPAGEAIAGETAAGEG